MVSGVEHSQGKLLAWFLFIWESGSPTGSVAEPSEWNPIVIYPKGSQNQISEVPKSNHFLFFWIPRRDGVESKETKKYKVHLKLQFFGIGYLLKHDIMFLF